MLSAGTNNTLTVAARMGRGRWLRADFGLSDPNDSPANSLTAVKITSLPSAGSLTLDGAAVTLNQVISKADLDAKTSSCSHLRLTQAAPRTRPLTSRFRTVVVRRTAALT